MTLSARGPIMRSMAGLALAGANPNSSFGDPSYSDFVVAPQVLRRDIPTLPLVRNARRKNPRSGWAPMTGGHKARLFSRGDSTLRPSKIRSNAKKCRRPRAVARLLAIARSCDVARATTASASVRRFGGDSFAVDRLYRYTRYGNYEAMRVDRLAIAPCSPILSFFGHRFPPMLYR